MQQSNPRVRRKPWLRRFGLLACLFSTACIISPRCDRIDLEIGDPCRGSFYEDCPFDSVCCNSFRADRFGSNARACSWRSECREGGLGQACRDALFGGYCDNNLTCVSGICECAPTCFAGNACITDYNSCSFSCCGSGEICVSGTCVAGPTPDAGAEDASAGDSDISDANTSDGTSGDALGSDALGDDSISSDVLLEDTSANDSADDS